MTSTASITKRQRGTHVLRPNHMQLHDALHERFLPFGFGENVFNRGRIVLGVRTQQHREEGDKPSNPAIES